jgi:hypothetical protein
MVGQANPCIFGLCRVDMPIPASSGVNEGTSVPLPSRQAGAIETAFENLAGLLLNQGERCNQNVLGKLQTAFGFSVVNFATYLQQGAKFFDGRLSTTPIAGGVTSPEAASTLYGVGATVSSVFATNPGGLQVNAMTSMTASTLTVYFRPSAIRLGNGGLNVRNLVLLFHEALHGYGGSLGGTSYNDRQLQVAFFGAGSPQVGAASSNISAYIRANCFH